jgi:hypothetical protein
MVRYLVDQPFVDYGLYHSIGDIISDASIIMNLEVKIHNGVLIPIDDEEKPIPDYLTILLKNVPRSAATTLLSNAISPSILSVSIPNQGIGILTTLLPYAPAPCKPFHANVYPADGVFNPGFGAA